MTTDTAKKRKLPPGQQAIVDALRSGATVIRSCGSYWLRDKDHPKDQRWALLRTATVTPLLRDGILRSDGPSRTDEYFSLNPLEIDSEVVADSPSP